jgi:hypothetical protein
MEDGLSIILIASGEGERERGCWEEKDPLRQSAMEKAAVSSSI